MPRLMAVRVDERRLIKLPPRYKNARTATKTYREYPQSVSIRAHVGILAGASQKFDGDERREQRLRRDRVEAPQPLCLRPRQTQAGVFEIFGTYELEPVGDVRWQHIHSFASFQPRGISSKSATLGWLIRKVPVGRCATHVAQLRRRENTAHFAQQCIRYTRRCEKRVAASVLGALALGTPRAYSQDDDGNGLRAFIALQSRNELETVYATGKKRFCHDDVSVRRNP